MRHAFRLSHSNFDKPRLPYAQLPFRQTNPISMAVTSETGFAKRTQFQPQLQERKRQVVSASWGPILAAAAFSGGASVGATAII